MSNISPTATIRLAQILQTEPEDSLNRLIAQTIVLHMHDIEHLSTNDIAHLCNISKTSFIRFCRHLGYETFSDFKLALLHNQMDTHHKYSLQIDNSDAFANIYFEHLSQNINWMKEHLDLTAIRNMAQDLLIHENVYVLGNAQSGNSANSLMFGLLQLGKLCQVATIYKDQMQLVSHLKPKSMVLILSNFGDFFEMFVKPDCFKDAPEDIVIYLLTCNSSLTTPARVNHVILCSNDAGFAGGNLSMDIVLTLLLQYYRPLALNHRDEPEKI